MTSPRGPVVVAGASGFMGRALVAHWREAGREVRTIGRAGSGADATWGDGDAIRQVIDGSAMVVNLAGKSVNCRYHAVNRAEIVRSRVETTRELAEAIADVPSTPPLWINSSTATIYRHAEDRPMTESDGEIGTGFSVSVATAWERELFAPDLPETRRVAIRTAIVLGDGSALIPLLRLARWGLGGPQWDTPWFSTRERRTAGTQHRFAATWGRQRFSWIHLDDVARALDFIEADDALTGPINLSSPNPVDGVELMRTLRRVLRMPVGLPAPRPVLEVGAWLVRTETELLLKSRWVLPERLTRAGFEFAVPDLEDAVRHVVAQRGGVR